MDIKSILQEKFKDHLSEESLSDITHAFESAIQNRVAELQEQAQSEFSALVEQKASELVEQRVALQVEAALIKIDEDHSKKLEHLLESIDNDHTTKLQKLVEAIDSDHTTKLKNVVQAIDEKHADMLEYVVEKYETALKTEAVSYKEKLVEEVSNYLELYLDKIVPTKQIDEAVENIQARRIIDQIRQLVSIDEQFINSEIKEALIDGKETITSLQKELNEAVQQNTNLNQRLGEVESALLLENKTKTLDDSTKRYVKRLLKGKTVDYINENYQYVVEMFEKETRMQEELHKDEVVQKRLVESVVDRPELEYSSINESIVTSQPQQSSGGVIEYLTEMKRFGNKYSRK